MASVGKRSSPKLYTQHKVMHTVNLQAMRRQTGRIFNSPEDVAAHKTFPFQLFTLNGESTHLGIFENEKKVKDLRHGIIAAFIAHKRLCLGPERKK